jgi:hypothetical protein
MDTARTFLQAKVVDMKEATYQQNLAGATPV